MIRVMLICLLGGCMMEALLTEIVAGAEHPADFFVAVDGDDKNHGTKEKPFATLIRARDTARRLGTNQVRRIIVRGGTYYGVSLSLDAQDSGLAIMAVSGEKPVLYGGVRITGWEKDGEKFFAAKLPGGQDRTWDFRSLVVNGELCPRARLPRTGEFTHLTRFDARWHTTSGGGFRGADKPELKLRMQYRKGDLGPWLDVKSAELDIFHQWDSSVVGLASHDPDTQTVVFSNPSGNPPGAFGVHRYVVWNIREGMHAPGQWYLDRSRGTVVYWPKPDEDINRLEVVAPTTECIVRINGSLEMPVSRVTLEGLHFCATTTPLLAGGWAASLFKGAVEARFVRNCTLRNLHIASVGGQGVRMAESVGGLVKDCEIVNTGAGGIYDIRGADNRIIGNRIRSIGRIYTSAIGIRTTGGGQKQPELSHDNEISHNEVSDTPYVGIEFDGWKNCFESNLVYDVMRVLNDGAALYGSGKEIILRGNVVRGIARGKVAHGYYIDELGEHCLVEGNAAFDCEWPVHIHMATNNTIRNNLFVSKGSCHWTFPRSKSSVVEQNVVFAGGDILVENPSAVASWKSNLFFSQKGEYCGVPAGGVERTDPLFVNPQKGDYRFKPDSPALRLGIKPLQLNNVGPQMKAASGPAEITVAPSRTDAWSKTE